MGRSLVCPEAEHRQVPGTGARCQSRRRGGRRAFTDSAWVSGRAVCSQPGGEPAPGWNWAWTGTRGGLRPLGLGKEGIWERLTAVEERPSMMVGQGPAVLETLDAGRTDRAVELDRGGTADPSASSRTARSMSLFMSLLVLDVICCGTGVTTYVNISMCPAQRGQADPGPLLME